jgi:hypothetical protein
MGHESLATTAIYVDVPLKQRTAAVDLLPSLNRKQEILANLESAAQTEQLLLFS